MSDEYKNLRAYILELEQECSRLKDVIRSISPFVLDDEFLCKTPEYEMAFNKFKNVLTGLGRSA